MYSGIGSVLLFHRVLPRSDARTFSPNARLQVAPEFFEALIEHLLRAQYDLVDMTEVKRRLDGHSGRKFACLTFDDGYRDNFEHAYSIAQRHSVPFTVYLVSGFVERIRVMWWLGLERVLSQESSVAFEFRGLSHLFDTSDPEKKHRCFRQVGELFTSCNTTEQEALMDVFQERYAVDFRAASDEATLTWTMVHEMARSGLVEFGAHTVSHYPLRTLSEPEARSEIAGGAQALAEHVGYPVRHLSYPFGGRAHARSREFRLAAEFGFDTAVTTRHGNLMRAHRDHCWAIPRLSVNGLYQDLANIDVYLSGASAALAHGLKRVITD